MFRSHTRRWAYDPARGQSRCGPCSTLLLLHTSRGAHSRIWQHTMRACWKHNARKASAIDHSRGDIFVQSDCQPEPSAAFRAMQPADTVRHVRAMLGLSFPADPMPDPFLLEVPRPKGPATSHAHSYCPRNACDDAAVYFVECAPAKIQCISSSPSSAAIACVPTAGLRWPSTQLARRRPALS